MVFITIRSLFTNHASSIYITYIWSGDTYNPDGTYKQKTVIATKNFISKFSFDGPSADCDTLFTALISLPECHFSHPPPNPS
jgi:hypothetical protein